MDLLDPRIALLAAGAAVVGSERVRKTVGTGVGYAATGAARVGGPVVGSIVNAGRDIVDQAREVSGTSGRGHASRTGTKSRSSS